MTTYTEDTRSKIRNIYESNLTNGRKLRLALSLVYELAGTLDDVHGCLKSPIKCNHCKQEVATPTNLIYLCDDCDKIVFCNDLFWEAQDLSEPYANILERESEDNRAEQPPESKTTTIQINGEHYDVKSVQIVAEVTPGQNGKHVLSGKYMVHIHDAPNIGLSVGEKVALDGLPSRWIKEATITHVADNYLCCRCQQ